MPFESITGLVGARVRWMRGLGVASGSRAVHGACVRSCTCRVRCWALSGSRVLVWACWRGAAVAVPVPSVLLQPQPQTFLTQRGGRWAGERGGEVYFISPTHTLQMFLNQLVLI